VHKNQTIYQYLYICDPSALMAYTLLQETPLAWPNQLRVLFTQLHGLFLVKLAVLLMLEGGVSRHDPGSSRLRGDCHLLLIGDPGLGEAQIQI